LVSVARIASYRMYSVHRYF